MSQNTAVHVFRALIICCFICKLISHLIAVNACMTFTFQQDVSLPACARRMMPRVLGNAPWSFFKLEFDWGCTGSYIFFGELH